MKLEIPKFRYLAQDEYGRVESYTKSPVIIERTKYWFSEQRSIRITRGKQNPNWRDTLIDLEVDDYEFEDGILRRVEK